MRYKDAGVDIDAGAESVSRIRKLVRSTFSQKVLTDIGGFGALFDGRLKGYREPVLVSSCDGVGTKLKVAVMAGIHHTVGQDLVNHCVNDILVQGAQPLFFMDYAAFGRLEPKILEAVIKGFVKACRENGCSLIGGETAEMPGMYQPGDYDLAGFIVGVVERKKLITGERIRLGDAVIGLATNGLQTNGYSLARKILFEKGGYRINDYLPELGTTIAKALLAVHPSFLKSVRPLLAKGWARGLAHITGGGLVDNIPRILPPGCAVEIKRDSWPVLPIFKMLQRLGQVPEDDTYRTFNMGIGFVLIVSSGFVRQSLRLLRNTGARPFVIGQVVHGHRNVILA